jgi:glyoxylase-like metal-dependent hydrolase (beta-lactamase superfamily II)
MKIWSTSGGFKIIRVLSGRSNVFLLTNGQTKILVDTSAGFMWDTLQRRLDRQGIEKLDLLILTHSHFDHAANAAAVREKYRARVVIHKSEAEFLSTGANILPTGTNRFTEFLIRAFANKFRSVARYKPCSPDITFDDVFSLSDFGFNAYVMHTPGHTFGSVSVIIDDETALVGDTMFGKFPGSVFPPFAADVSQLLKSWDKLLGTKCRIFIPSHGIENKRALVEKDFKKRSTGKTD